LAIALVVHGGAWNIPDPAVEPSREGVRAALTLGWHALGEGAAALDVVEMTVRALEDDPHFDAGRGSRLNREGKVELDASIMLGSNLEAGAVAAIQKVLHPITVARRVMERSPHVMLVGEGARKFAEEVGADLCRTRDLLVGRDGTSTGGTQNKHAGRVGDTPIIGAGTYADDIVGGSSATGWGEGILRVALTKGAVDHMAAGLDPRHAGEKALASLRRVRGRAGLILLDRHGRVATVFNTPRMARGWATEAEGLRVAVEPEEDRP
jgi:beta-aspartyl-peptidase (threonine type)